MRSKWLSVRKRRSHVGGRWGVHLLHANEWGGLVLPAQTKPGLHTWHGIHVKTPWYFITFVFRYRELKV